MHDEPIPRGIILAGVDQASAAGCRWAIRAPSKPGQPWVLKVWEPEPRELTPEEKGQLVIPGCEVTA